MKLSMINIRHKIRSREPASHKNYTITVDNASGDYHIETKDVDIGCSLSVSQSGWEDQLDAYLKYRSGETP